MNFEVPPRAPQLEETPETPPSSRAEGLLFLHRTLSPAGLKCRWCQWVAAVTGWAARRQWDVLWYEEVKVDDCIQYKGPFHSSTPVAEDSDGPPASQSSQMPLSPGPLRSWANSGLALNVRPPNIQSKPSLAGACSLPWSSLLCCFCRRVSLYLRVMSLRVAGPHPTE